MTNQTFLTQALHPKLADTIPHILTEAKARGMSVGLHSGVRSKEHQDSLYWRGRKEVNPDGASAANPMGRIVTNCIGPYGWHCLGMAADLVFKDEKGTWSWAESWPWGELGKIGEMMGLSWGGRWASPDRPHFEVKIKDVGIIRAVQIVEKNGIETLWGMAK